MNAGWLPVFLLLFIIFANKKETRRIIEMRIKKKNGDNEMQELAKRFIGKDVYIKTVGGTEDGILTEVADNAAVLEKDGKSRIVNLDYVVRLMEYPKNKKGKRKSLISE